MQTAQLEKQYYESGFPKKISRKKYDLPLNERLKIARNLLGMSSARVITELKNQGFNLSQSTLQGYEANEASANHRYPPLPTLYELTELYDCSMDYLFGYSDKIQKPNSNKPFKTKIDLKKQLESDEYIMWDGRKIQPRQLELIKTQIEFILGRTGTQ